MKNMALTIARLVLPLELEAVKDSNGDMTAVMQDAWTCQLMWSTNDWVCTYEPGGCYHAPACIDCESHEKHTADQRRDDQDHGHQDAVSGE